MPQIRPYEGNLTEDFKQLVAKVLMFQRKAGEHGHYVVQWVDDRSLYSDPYSTSKDNTELLQKTWHKLADFIEMTFFAMFAGKRMVNFINLYAFGESHPWNFIDSPQNCVVGSELGLVFEPDFSGYNVAYSDVQIQVFVGIRTHIVISWGH